MKRLVPALALLFFSGCSETHSTPNMPLDTSSWLAEAIITPSAFEALTSANRDGWVALHASDLNTAVGTFPSDSTGQYRARLARQTVYADLAAMTDLAIWRTLQVWQTRGLPTDDGILGVVPLWRRCGGPQRLPSTLTDGATIPFDGTLIPTWANDRVAAYGADVEALRELVAVPVMQSETRIIRDPCGYAFLLASDDPAALIETLSEAQGLASRFLSAMPTADDLAHQSASTALPGIMGATSPSLPPFEATDLPSLHASVQALDTVIEEERLRIVQQAPLDGVSLLSELSLAERLRQEVLVARSRTLMDEYPALAGALADIAWDATDRAIGPRNTAGAASARARALLQQGRTREALDALEPLLTAMPESAGAREWVADLSVLESLDRAADSKEE